MTRHFEPVEYSGDPADRSQPHIDAEIKRGIAAARRQTVEKQKIVDGVVVCLDCDEPIPLERLAAKPKAALCVPCKTDREQGRS